MTSSGKYWQFSWQDWLKVCRKAFTLSRQCRISDFAYSAAFNAVLALFPGTLAIITLYGLFIDSSTVQQQVSVISSFLPTNISSMAEERMTSLAEVSKGNLGWVLAASTSFAAAVTYRGTSTLLSTLSAIHAHHLDNSIRPSILSNIISSVSAVVFIVLCLSLLILIPSLVHYLPELIEHLILIRMLIWPGLFVVICLALGILYRFSRTIAPEQPFLFNHWLSPGAIAASLIWLIGSGLFSYYVRHFGQYDLIFGSLSAFAVLMIWLYLTNFIILLGAVLNTAIASVEKNLFPKNVKGSA